MHPPFLPSPRRSITLKFGCGFAALCTFAYLCARNSSFLSCGFGAPRSPRPPKPARRHKAERSQELEAADVRAIELDSHFRQRVIRATYLIQVHDHAQNRAEQFLFVMIMEMMLRELLVNIRLYKPFCVAFTLCVLLFPLKNSLSGKVISRLHGPDGAIEELLRFKALCNSSASLSNLLFQQLLLGSSKEADVLSARTHFLVTHHQTFQRKDS